MLVVLVDKKTADAFTLWSSIESNHPSSTFLELVCANEYSVSCALEVYCLAILVHLKARSFSFSTIF